MINLKRLPKIELHVHFDGSLDLETISLLSGLKMEVIEPIVVAPFKCEDLKDYLDRFKVPVSLLQNLRNIRLFAEKLRISLIDDGVFYAEVRYAPMKHFVDRDKMIEIIYEELNKSNKLKVNLILCMMRGDSEENNKEVINLAYKHLNKEVVAVDLAGDEKKYPLDNYYNLFSYADRLRIPYTIHAGEVGNTEELGKVLNTKARRVGHGISIIKDESLINDYRDRHIMLEICPTSNVQTNAVSSFSSHPIKEIKDKNLLYSVSTDNRLVSNTNLTLEYQKLIDRNLLDLDDIINFTYKAINSSFMSIKDKERASKIYSEVLKNQFKDLS